MEALIVLCLRFLGSVSSLVQVCEIHVDSGEIPAVGRDPWEIRGEPGVKVPGALAGSFRLLRLSQHGPNLGHAIVSACHPSPRLFLLSCVCSELLVIAQCL